MLAVFDVAPLGPGRFAGEGDTGGGHGARRTFVCQRRGDGGPGIGTAQAHHTVSTAVMGIGVSFHDPVAWDGWIRYHHESTFAGAGMAYARGQVLTADGRCSPRSPRTR